MSEAENEQELTEPSVTDVPEPDQEPTETEAEEEADQERQHEAEQAAPPEAQGTTPEEWEQRFKKSEKRFETYHSAVKGIWDKDADDLIPFSISPSAPPGFINRHDAGRVPEDIQRATFEFFGLAREQDYEPDPETRECLTCKGKGKTMTGSHVAGKETRACPVCKGSGAEGLPSQLVTPTASNGAAENFTLADLAPTDVPDADNWGEPRILPDGRENPNWGKQPQYKVLVEPWGVTLNLTAQDAAV